MFEIPINKGINLLDRVRPGWQWEIDLTTFDISHPFHCLLGQLFQTYSIGLQTMFVHYGDSSKHGFNAPIRDLDTLTEEWKGYLTTYRETHLRTSDA